MLKPFKKYLLFISIITLPFLSFSQAGRYCAKAKIKSFEQNRSNTLPLNYIALTEEYDVHFYKLDINVERTNTNISGVVDMYATSKVQLLDTILFELHNNLNINSILLDGTPVSFTRVGTAVIVPSNIALGQSFIVSIDYAGFSGGAGMSHGTSNSWGNQATWTLSESFAAYHWFPCKQSLTDKIDSVYVFATTDAANMVGSNGLLTNVVNLGNGTKRYEWKSHYPIDYYLISFSVAKYVDYSIYANPVGAPNPILVQNFIYDNPATLTNFQADIDKTANFIEYFSTLYGLYPFHQEKYGHCMAPFGGGMEHQTMTTQGWFSDGLTVHEMGHQWFGDNVTCASWSDIWLNEGFASYTEYLMDEHFNPGNEVSLMQGLHDNVMSQNGGSVWVLDSLNENRIFSGRLTYDKGSAIIHTIRFLVNDDAQFFQILQQYQVDFKDSTAHASDFKSICESVTGKDFTNFFNEWYYGEGFPTYSAEWAFVDNKIYLKLLQTTSTNITPLFTNDLEVKLTGTNGNTTTARLENVTSNGQIFIIPFDAPLTSITFDPNNWIINQNGTVTEDANMVASISENEMDFLIYPNPVSEVLNIKNPSQQTHLKVYNSNGKLISTYPIVTGYNSINLKPLAQGVYIISIGDFTHEIIVE